MCCDDVANSLNYRRLMGDWRAGSATNTAGPDRQSPSEGKSMTATYEGSGSRSNRRLNTVSAGDGDPRHGKYTTYTNHKCHCDLCRAAWSEYCRDLRDRRAEQAAG